MYINFVSQYHIVYTGIVCTCIYRYCMYSYYERWKYISLLLLLVLSVRFLKHSIKCKHNYSKNYSFPNSTVNNSA